MESYTLEDLYNPSLQDYSRGHQEDARRIGVKEFFDLISSGESTGSSSLLSHNLSSKIMSSVYESVALDTELTHAI